MLQRDKSSGGYSRHGLFNFPVQESSAKKLISFAGELGLLVQYYNGLTGQVLSVPLTDEHRILSARYAALVGKQQRFIATYDEALAESQSAKLLVLTSDPDDLLIKVHHIYCSFNTYSHDMRSCPERPRLTSLRMNSTSFAALQIHSL